MRFSKNPENRRRVNIPGEIIMSNTPQFRADVQEQKLTDNSIAYNVAFFEVGKSTTIIPARDQEDAYARVEAIRFAFRDLD